MPIDKDDWLIFNGQTMIWNHLFFIYRTTEDSYNSDFVVTKNVYIRYMNQ